MNTLIKTYQSKIDENEISILDGQIFIPKNYLLDRAFLKDNSILVISGSLIEGIGNIHSDIDCIVICDQRPTAIEIESTQHALVTDNNYRHIVGAEDVYNTTDFFGNTSIHIDVDYITFKELDLIIDRIEHFYQKIIEDQRVVYEPLLSNTENNIIHRLLTGHALTNEKKLQELTSCIPVDKHIYLAHREKLPVFYAFQDIQGCWESENLWMGCEIARDMMLKTTMSFTYLTGTTNKHYKWVYSNIFRTEGFDEIKTKFFNLSRTTAITRDECREFILTTLEYMDMVFFAIEDLLKTFILYPTEKESLEILNMEFNNRKHTDHKTSKCEYHFRKKYFLARDTPSLTSLLREWD